MLKGTFLKLLLTNLCLMNHYITAANILVLLPYPFKSHYKITEPYIFELSKRGHNVTCANHFPKNEPIENYTDVDIGPCLTTKDDMTIEEIYATSRTIRDKHNHNYKAIENDEVLVSCLQWKKLWKPQHKYDLIIAEVFYTELYFAFIHKFGVPFITIFANALPPYISEHIATPDNPSYIAYPFIPNKFDLVHPTFYERVYNTYIYIYLHVVYNIWFRPRSQKIATEQFGVVKPSITKIAKNSSLVLAYSHFVSHGPKPLVPVVVDVGGMHIKNVLPLPDDIEKFINESKHGVIYFCMGSLLRSETMPEEKRNAFLYAFSKIRQRVLWKWDGEFPGKPANVLISKWMPQRDILAHPKVKLFISHGGALGLNEAVYEAVPVLGIPIFGDQTINLHNLKMQGMAELLEYHTIANETVLQKLLMLLNDISYKENAKRMSKIYRDRPMSPLDTAVYWTEYVIRHKGAYHLRSAAVDLPWYQYLLLDVIAFILALILFSCLVLYYICKTSLSYLSIIFFKSQKPNNHKKSL